MAERQIGSQITADVIEAIESADGMEPVNLLTVKNLRTHFHTRAGVVKAVDDVSFSVDEGETLGLAGESGSGKSITCLSIVRLVPRPAGRIVSGEILFQGEDLLAKPEAEMVRWRGSKIGMILQDPLMSLNPVYTVGNQVAEPFQFENKRTGKNNSYGVIREKVVNILKSVRIPSPEQRLKDFPFQFSGGMRQRTAAAMAMAGAPKLLIADEPTTALDVTIQDQFLCLLKEIQAQQKMGLIFVTHDLGIVAEICDRVAIMYAGRIVEYGGVYRIFEDPAHPYTQALLRALPKMGTPKKRLNQIIGEPPNLAKLPPGCSFHPRCPSSMDICRRDYPPTSTVGQNGRVACWLFHDREV